MITAMNDYVYSQTTAATTVQCTTSVQQIGQRQTESTNMQKSTTNATYIYIQLYIYYLSIVIARSIIAF